MGKTKVFCFFQPLLFSAMLIFALPVFAHPTCSETHINAVLFHLFTEHQTGGKIFASLQDPRTAAVEGGNCGPVCAVNLAQALRKSLKIKPELDPYALVRDLFSNVPYSRYGNADPQDLHQILQYLIKHYTPGESIDLKSETMANLGLSDPGFTDVQKVHSITLDDLAVGAGKFKIILMMVLTPEKHLEDGHYVLAKSLQGNKLTVIDPNKPELESSFVISDTHINGQDTLRLTPEGESYLLESQPDGSKLMVTSVFTVKHD